jgi:hypothetical protein
VVVPLLGRFKGEEHHQQHLLAVAAVTNSGLQPRKWLEALVVLQECQGWVQGPATCDDEGFVTKQAEMNAAFLSCLESVHKEQPNLFPLDASVSDYNVDHSFCRGSDSRAKALGIVLDDINTVHPWRKVERARGWWLAQSMSDSYADIKLTHPQFNLCNTLGPSERDRTGIGVPCFSYSREGPHKVSQGVRHPR